MEFHKVDVVGDALTSLQSIEAEALDPYQHTAFGEARVSLPYTLADIISKYGRNPLEVESFTSGSGAVADSVANSGFILSGGFGVAGSARVRSSSYYRYQSGRGMKVTHTIVLQVPPAVPTEVARYGFFDDNDGIFWEWTADGLGFPVLNLVIRSSTSGVPVETRVLYANADSPVALDGTKGNIYEIQFQWLGVGNVQFFVNGSLVHTFRFPNTLVSPYMRTADLPIAWEVIQGPSSGFNVTMLCICGNVTVQSGQNPPEYGFGVERDAFLAGIGPAYVPLLAIRLAPTLNGVDNRSVIYPTRVIVSCETSRTAFRLLLNPATLTGAVFNPVGGNSCMQFDIAATAFTGGEYLTGDFLPGVTDSRNIGLSDVFSVNARKMRRSSFAPGTSDVLLVVGRNEAGGTATMRAGLQWSEVR